MSEPREKHLHLRDGGVLCLVEDDEGIVERSAAHVGQRNHLHDVLLREPFHGLVVHHLAERVEQRPQIGIDLGLHVAGQVAEALTRLDRGPDEDDLADLPGAKAGHGQGHGEKCLAAPRRSRAEDDVVIPDRLHVGCLARRLGHQLPSRPGHLDRVRGGLGRGIDDPGEQPGHLLRLHRAAIAGDTVELLEDFGGPKHGRFVPLDLDRVVPPVPAASRSAARIRPSISMYSPIV